MFKISKENGFSLLELTIVMGLMGAFIISFMRLSDRMVESESKMMDLMQMNDLVSEVRYTLNDSTACTKSLSVASDSDGFIFPESLVKIVNRRDKVVIESGKSNGRVKIKNIRVNLETLDETHIEEEPIFSKIFLDVSGRSKLTRNKVFKISVPVLVSKKNGKTYFHHCDSLTAGIAQEMTNQIMKRMCASFSVPYDDRTGQCEFDKMSLDSPMLKGDMFKDIDEMIKSQLPKN
jgi:hypothetical protein